MISEDEIEKVYVRYVVNNKEYNGTLKETSTNMYEGQSIEIYYDLNNPQLFIQNNSFDNNLFKYAGYVILLLGVIQIINAINKLVLYLSTLKGREVDAKVERVIEKRNSFNTTYMIECKWIDELGREYTFYSKKFDEPYFMKEFEKMNIDKLPVRFKDNNRKRYIVITEKIDKKLMV